MVEVQPPPEWQDETGQVANPNAPPAAPETASAAAENAVATGSRWLVPSIAGGAVVLAGLLSWLVWSQLREPDRPEPLPLAERSAESHQSTDAPVNDEGSAASAVDVPANNSNEQQSALPPPLPVIDPPVVAENPPQPNIEQAPPAATVTAPAATSPESPQETPPKPRLVLKPEDPPPAAPESPLFARGPEVNPAEATQAKPIAEGEEKSVFAAPDPAPAEMPPAIAPVVPQPLAAAQLTRIPFKPVNAKQLELMLAAVSYEQVPLDAFLRELGELADVEIGVDDATLFRNGWRLNTPVRIKLENVSVRGALQAALRPLELDLVVKENYLWVTQAAASEPTHLTRYPIDDLVSKADSAADAELLAAQVQRAVPAERWAGGKIDIVPGALLITQSAGVHDELIVWFEKLRVARGLPLRTKYDPANALLRRFAPQRFALTTRWELAEPLLSKSVTASFPEQETLREITMILARQTQATFLWDFPALEAAGFSPESTTAFTVESAPLGRALEQLLEPLGLAVVPLDDTSLLLTTKTAAARRQITERYNIGRLLEQRRWPLQEAAITEALHQELNTRKLELAETVPMSWDRASRTLAVSASPLVHRVIAEILGQAPQKPVAAAAVIKK